MTPGKIAARLGGGRQTGQGYMCKCPCHDDKTPSLSIRKKNGRLLFKCFAGCKTSNIIAALERKGINVGRATGTAPSHATSGATAQQSGLTLEQYAEAKVLPVEFLEDNGVGDYARSRHPAVRMEYRDANGNAVATRLRVSMHGDNRFLWRKGDKPTLYGLDKLRDFQNDGFRHIWLVEGESDAQTLWYQGEPALGIPGAGSWREDRDAALLDEYDRIFVVIEPDAGGEAMLAWLTKSKIRQRVWIVRLGDFKDVSELHVDDPDQFLTRWGNAIASAVHFEELQENQTLESRNEAWKQCKTLASAENILDAYSDDLNRCGLVGERRNAKLIFLALVTRLFDRPVSIVVKGPSSGGKSFLVKTVLQFFPVEAWYELTAMSEKALVYFDQNMEHRFLVIFEAEGIGGQNQSYFLRTLLSEGMIRYQTVIKTPDGPVGHKIEVKGPTGLLVTTTRTSLHAENETRLFSLNVLETPEHTAAIFECLAEGINATPFDFAEWHALQRWLSLKSTAVVVPYARVLPRLIPPRAPRLHRDFKGVLALIQAHALLHRASRELDSHERVVATIADYAAVRRLVASVVARGVEAAVRTPVRQIVEAVTELQKDGTHSRVSVSDLARHLKLNKSTASRNVRDALLLGYLRNEQDRKGQQAELDIGDPLPDEQDILPAPEAVEAAVAALHAKREG